MQPTKPPPRCFYFIIFSRSIDFILSSINRRIENPGRSPTQEIQKTIVHPYESTLRELGHDPCPLTITTCQLYRGVMMQRGGCGGNPWSHRTLHTCMSTVCNCAFKINDHSIQTEFAPIFLKILKSFVNKVGNSTKQKKVLLTTQISQLLEDKIEMFKSNRDNKDVLLWGRNIAMIAIRLADCVSAGEMLNLKCNDFAFREDHLQITVQRSKDIDGRLVNIFPQKFYCPIRYLNNYQQIR